MKKNTLKFIVDTILFVDACSVAAIGLLLGFVIPKGRGRGAGSDFLGLGRHDWGDIHLSLSVFLLVLLAIHLWLNRAWIVQSTKRYFGDHWKRALWCLSGAWIVVLIVAWIAVTI